MKHFLLSFLMLLGICQYVQAEDAPYVLLTGEGKNKTLTFYYGEKPEGALDITSYYDGEPENRTWEADTANIKTVVFDSSFANYHPTSTSYWFYRFKNLTSIEGIANLKTDEVTDMGFMFGDCKKLETLDLSSFDTHNVTYMGGMFDYCSGLTSLDLSSFDTHNVTSMGWMFEGCYMLSSLDLSSFDTHNVTFMGDMFWGCRSLLSLDLSNFNTSSVDYMQAMFGNCLSLTSLNISSFDTRNVIYMSSMFESCYSLTELDLSNFNTSNVEYMSFMFYGCSSLTSLDLSKFNTSKVNNMNSMFRGCSSLTSLDLSNFDTQNVTDMWSMFRDCSKLATLNISGWNTSKVTEMSEMFRECVKLTTVDVSSFDTQNVTQMISTFYHCYSLRNLDVSGFNTQNVIDMGWMFYGCSGLQIIDVSHFNTSNVTSMRSMFCGCNNLNYIDLSSFDTQLVTDMRYMFSDASRIKIIYVGTGWSTENVTVDTNMFSGCTALVGENNTTFTATAINKAYARVDLGKDEPGYFTSRVGAYAQLTTGENEKKVMTFYYGERPYDATYIVGFYYKTPAERSWYSERAKINIMEFDSTFAQCSPNRTSHWFNGCSKLEEIRGLYYLNTSETTDMASMFNNCSLITELNLSSFNTSNVTNMNNLFRNSPLLRTIYVGEGWDMSNVTNATGMFAKCTSLVGGNGTVFDENYVNGEYAHVDGGAGNPGYFTDIPVGITAPTAGSGADAPVYTLDGKRFNTVPNRKGIYIRNGSKFIVN